MKTKRERAVSLRSSPMAVNEKEPASSECQIAGFATSEFPCKKCGALYFIPERVQDTSDSLRFAWQLCNECWRKMVSEYWRDIETPKSVND